MGWFFLSIMRLNYKRKRNQCDLCCFFEVIITVSIKVSSNDTSSTSLFVEGFNFKPATWRGTQYVETHTKIYRGFLHFKGKNCFNIVRLQRCKKVKSNKLIFFSFKGLQNVIILSDFLAVWLDNCPSRLKNRRPLFKGSKSEVMELFFLQNLGDIQTRAV